MKKCVFRAHGIIWNQNKTINNIEKPLEKCVKRVLSVSEELTINSHEITKMLRNHWKSVYFVFTAFAETAARRF